MPLGYWLNWSSGMDLHHLMAVSNRRWLVSSSYTRKWSTRSDLNRDYSTPQMWRHTKLGDEWIKLAGATGFEPAYHCLTNNFITSYDKPQIKIGSRGMIWTYNACYGGRLTIFWVYQFSYSRTKAFIALWHHRSVNNLSTIRVSNITHDYWNWSRQLVTLQCLVLFRDTLIYLSYSGI